VFDPERKFVSHFEDDSNSDGVNISHSNELVG
jgi:hypothetical protein